MWPLARPSTDGPEQLRSFHKNPLSLRYNELLLSLNEGETIGEDGGALSHTSAITIGQVFLKNLQNSVSSLDPAKEMFIARNFYL